MRHGRHFALHSEIDERLLKMFYAGEGPNQIGLSKKMSLAALWRRDGVGGAYDCGEPGGLPGRIPQGPGAGL